MNTTAKYLSETAHRHSFNESIYSEPYSEKFAAIAGNHMNPLSESSSASNINSRNTALLRIDRPLHFLAQIDNSSSHRDVYGTTSSIASNYTSTEVSSARSSVYSDKTILNEQTPPTTPILSNEGNELTNKSMNPNNTIKKASNASGSQNNMQSKPINQDTESKMSTSSETVHPKAINSDKSPLNTHSTKTVDLSMFYL